MKPPRLWRRLRLHFLTGLIVIIPGIVAAWAVWILFDFTTQIIPLAATAIGLLDANGEPLSGHDQFLVRAVGLVVLILLTFLIGVFARSIIGRQILGSGEWVALRIPIFGTVYRSVKQIAGTFSSSRRGMFRQSVLFEYPKKDCWVIGFETSEAFAEAQTKVAIPLVAVFVPTTPNPTSGFLLFVPKHDLIYLDLSIGDAMQLIISGGVIHPELSAGVLPAVAFDPPSPPPDPSDSP